LGHLATILQQVDELGRKSDAISGLIPSLPVRLNC
jgi:hypothetical protein